MRRLLTALLVLAAAAAAVVLTGVSGGAEGKSYRIEFDNAFGLVEGGDLKVGGVRAGQTSGFKVGEHHGRAVAIVEVEATVPGFDSFRTDASCRIRQQSLIGEYFVDCQPGTAKQELADGGTVPLEQTASVIPEDLLRNVLRRPYRERLRLIVNELGTGLAGRPQDLNEAVRRAHPALRETTETLRILARQNRIIRNFISSSDTVIKELEAKKRDVARWVVEASETAEISATRREDIAASFRKLPAFLEELEPTMARLGDLADEQVPLLIDLRDAAPDLEEFFARLGPFSAASRPSLRSLGRATRTGRAALIESSEEIDELRKLAADAPELGKPLRQFLQTIDDRDRSYEIDPRAAESAPPAPDPTSNAKNKGFTGMEALLNYVYWQTLGINPFDEVSHMLRVVGFESRCAAYRTGADYEEEKELYEGCNSWLGPYQPGIVQDDPTAGGKEAVARARGRDLEPARRGERRGAGQPEAPALPGQRDISKPQVVLPPALQELLDRLPNLDELPSLPGGELPPGVPDTAPDQLLDFLLSP